MTPEKAARPEHIEADPRTDGVGDGGENELDPPTEQEIAAGVEHDKENRRAALAGYVFGGAYENEIRLAGRPPIDDEADW